MDNIKTDVMKAKEYIKNQYKELEDEYKNLLEDYFGDWDKSHIIQNRALAHKVGFQTLAYKIEFQMARLKGMELIEEIQAMQHRDEFLIDSEISVIVSRLKIKVAECLIKEYALRYELDERDKNNDE